MRVIVPFLIAVLTMPSTPPAVQAQDEPTPPPDLLAEFETALRIEHLLPHLRTIAADPDVEVVLHELTAGAIQASMATTLRFGSKGTPEAVAIGMDAGFVESLALICKMFVSFSLLTASLDDQAKPTDLISADDRQGLIGMIVEDLPRLPRGRLSLVLEALPDGEYAKMHKDIVTGIRSSMPVGVDVSDSSVVVDLGSACESIGLAPMLGFVTSQWGATPEQQGKIREWATGLSGELRIEGRGSWARCDVRLGPKLPSVPISSEVSARRARLDVASPEIAFQYDVTPMQSEFREIEQILERWDGTELWQRALAIDTEGFLSAVKFQIRQMDSWRSIGAGVIDLGARTTLRTLQHVGADRGFDLRNSSLVRCTPPDTVFWWLDGSQSFGQALFTSLIDAEGRLGLRSTTDVALEKRLEESYQRFGEAREHLAQLASDMPQGYGWVFDSPRPTDLGVMGEGSGVSAKAIPLPPMAFLFRCDHPERDRAQLEALIAQLALAVGSGEEDPAGFLRPADLGLEVPTIEIDLAMLTRRFGLEFEFSLADPVAGQPTPLHVFRVDDVQVISTSPHLSRKILAASRREGEPLLTGSGHVPSAMIDPFPLLAQTFRGLADWIDGEGTVETLGGGEAKPLPAPFVARFTKGCRSVGTAVQRLRIETYLDRIVDETRELQVVLAVAPSQTTISLEGLDPKEQEDRAVAIGLDWLVQQQQPDGRFTDPRSEGVSDLSLTALALTAFKGNSVAAFRDPQVYDALQKAQQWLESRQIAEGPLRGFFGDPEAVGAWEGHCLAMSALLSGAGVGQISDEAAGHLAVLIQSEATNREFTVEEAFWWRDGMFDANRLPYRLDYDDAARDRFDRTTGLLSVRLMQLGKDLRKSCLRPAVALEISRFSMGTEEREGAIEADRQRISPSAFASDPRSIDPLEILAITKIVSIDDLETSRAWINVLACRQFPRGSESAGAWPPLGGPYDSTLTATVFALVILGDLHHTLYKIPGPQPGDR